jgi:hypothetical protein
MRWVVRVAMLASLASGSVMVMHPASAQTRMPTSSQAHLVGVLGYEGGPYPGGFHPSAGSVEVGYSNPPLILDKRVGQSGHFRIALGPGTYSVVGCGPRSGSGEQTCGKAKTIRLTPGQTEHVRVIWMYAP